MDAKEFRKMQRVAAKKYYDEVPDEIKEDLKDAILWAEKTLMEEEGKGHIIQVHGTENNLVFCTFSKPSWAGEHSGSPMESGSEAIVMAVAEYLNGM